MPGDKIKGTTAFAAHSVQQYKVLVLPAFLKGSLFLSALCKEKSFLTPKNQNNKCLRKLK